MSWIQNGKNRNHEKPISGCLGRMVKLFDLSHGVRGNKLLTEKPHYDGSSFSRRQSDVTITSLVDDQMDDKVIVSDLKKSPSNRKPIGTPIKMLMAQEMSKEEDSKQSPSNLVAKLMGLDSLPHHHQLDSASKSGSQEFLHPYEICENDSSQKMALVREKFMEVKRLSSDYKLQQSKQYQDALQVLSSNKDTFLKFIQDPNRLFSQNLYNLQPVPPPSDSRRITILKPSKSVDNEKDNEKPECNKKGSKILLSPKCCKSEDNPTHPTRIVVLKPSSTSHHDVCDGDPAILSDSEVVLTDSWDYINRYNSHYCASSSRTSYSHESSVCREAKKRLSERWAMMSSNKNVIEQREEVQRSSSTLGDMLALSDSVKPDESAVNLLRSKSVPAREVTEDVVTEKLVKSSSFKGRVSSLFFSKNKSKDKSRQATSDMVVEEASCSVLRKSISLPEAGFSFTKSDFFGNHIENQDQPSPISVLEPQFLEDDQRTNCHYRSKPHEHGMKPMKYNLIDKSPPIGSISRTLSWDDSMGSPTRYSSKPSSMPLNPKEEEQECLFYVQTLLSVAGVNKIRSNSFLGKWHSPESPLDPSLRDKYMNLCEKEPIISRTKLRHHKSITKLVFDCVNEALIDIAGRGPYNGAHSSLDDTVMSSIVLVDRVWGQMKEWIPREGRCEWDDVGGGSVVVEREVMREVVGRGWVEGLRLEIDNTRKEIEGRLLEELVQEFVLELTCKVC